MHFNLLMTGLILFQVLAASFGAAPSPITASNNQAQLSFPEKITFSVDLKSSAEIKTVELEYGVNQLTCGSLVSKSFPDFEPANSVSVEWSWPMKQSGSLPTGAKIWWRWHVTDASGNSLVTDSQSVIWIDSEHPWKTLSQGGINLHWYNGDQTFGKDLLSTAVKSLDMLHQDIGLKPDGEINIYIYANSQDLSNTIYFQPDWTGGLAYPENNIILIGISEDVMEWGRHAVTHELTHVLVGHYTFTCLGDVPTWLNEGMAKYSEGEWDKDAQTQLKEAISSDELMSVRSLSSSFPEDSTKANLAYTQSQSLVSFLIKEYKPDKMLALLGNLRDGITIDEALKKVYGFDQDGLEDAWRTSVGAKPRSNTSEQVTPTAEGVATTVPTIQPISAVPPATTLSPTVIPPTAPPFEGSTIVPTPSAEKDGTSNTFYILIVVGVCGLCLVGIAIIVVIVLIIRSQKKKGTNS
jgi:hypothetical protein